MGHGEQRRRRSSATRARASGAAGGDTGVGDYVNCPLDKAQYEAFVAAVNAGRKVLPHDFEEPKYFESCMPIEVMAERGPQTLRFGPMRPIGLRDPRTGHRPWAVVQLRPENRYLTAYNLVGFQTRLAYPEQQRIFRMVPGARSAPSSCGSVRSTATRTSMRRHGSARASSCTPGRTCGSQAC